MNINEKIINLRKKGVGYKRIGKILNLPTTKVSEILIENNFTSHVTMPKYEIVNKIIEMYTIDHLGTVPISKKIGMSPNRIASILRRSVHKRFSRV